MGLISIAMGLAQAIPSIVGMFKGKDAEQQAEHVVNLAKQVSGIDDPQKAVDAVAADPDKLLAFKEKLLDHALKMREADNAQFEIVNTTMRAELASKDKYNSRWRATYGYLVAISWFITFLGLMIALIIIVAKDPEHIGQAVNAMGDMMASTAVLWSVALSVLGVTVSKRSRDKELVAGVTPSPGLFQAVISKLKTDR
jgi:hypothetical protein